MKKKLRSKIHTIALCTLLISPGYFANGQTWQWGKRGGSNFNGNNTNPQEAVADMATDKNGNVYLLALTESSGSPNIDGHTLTTRGEKDIVVASFTCGGTFRWAKIIGGAGRDFTGTIATDTVGHVFVCGKNTPTNQAGDEIHFASDSTQPVSDTKSIYLVAYDTLGNYKWLRQPSADTAGFSSNFTHAQSLDMFVTGNGDVYWLTQMNAGLVSGGGGWAAVADKAYILHYNAQGTMVDHVAPQMDISATGFISIHMARTGSGKFILAGAQDLLSGNPMTIGTQQVTHTMFMAAFSASGQSLWEKENALSGYQSRIWSRPQIDVPGNIYYSGDCQAGDAFNSFTFYNSISSIPTTIPFIGKADSNGNHLWIKVGGGNAADVQSSLALKNSNEIWMSGSANSVWWDTAHHIQGAPNSGYYMYAARFSASGTILALDSLKGNVGSLNYAYCNAVDRNGNLYIGGEFNSNLLVGTQTLINSGGNSDFFIARYGYPCNCTAPAAAFNSITSAVKTVQFTYSGSTALDSLRWTFGDGQTQKIVSGFTAPVTHTYAANGSYNACVTVYNSCGSNAYCKQYSLSVEHMNSLENVMIYPNPVSDNLIVENAAVGSVIFIYDIVGRQVISYTMTQKKASVSLTALPPGNYLLQLRGKLGDSRNMKILKQ